MKLKHILIENFKGVRNIEFPTDATPHALRAITARGLRRQGLAG